MSTIVGLSMTLADFLEREAGRIVVGLLLVLTALGCLAAGMEYARELLTFALGVLASSMNGKGNSVDRRSTNHSVDKPNA